MAKSKHVYKVIFFNQGQVYEIYSKALYQSDLYGFIEIEELTFNERAQMVVDPSEEKLKSVFSGVTRSYIPIHSIIRIDEVEKEGTAKISEAKGGQNDKVMPFPMPPMPSNSDES